MLDFVAISSHLALQQSPGFARALACLGRATLQLNDGTFALKRGPLLLLSRYQSRGRVLPDLLAGCRLPVLLNPDRPDPDLATIGAVPLISPVMLAELDLTVELRANLHQKWRNRLCHAEAQNLRVTRQNMPTDPGHWLLKADARQQRARGFRNWPVSLTCAFAKANPGDAKLFTAFAGKTPVAGILLLRHGTVATYHIACTTAKGRQYSAQNLLLWQAMNWASCNGVQRLDLGPISTEVSPGLARFKLGTGAKIRSLGGTWIWWPPLGKTLRPLAALDARLMQSGWTE